MRTLRRALPSPTSLVYFEAAARHRSFSTAAREMAVTQAAVSRQIRQLEDQVGIALFRRLHRRVDLTPEGIELAEAVSLGLSHIAQAISRIQRVSNKSLTIAANVAVMALWLRPRVMDFLHRSPEMDVRLIASDEVLDYAGDGIDLAIDYGSEESMPRGSTLLFPEVIWAVASPQLARKLAISSPRDLASARLLHEDQIRPEWVTWTDWLQAVNCDLEFQRIVRFNNYPILIEAASEGEGVALGWETLIDDYLRARKLVKLFSEHFVTGRGYYLVQPSTGRNAGAAARLGEALLAASGKAS
jgi:LysR family glycine cleavage system transcriptional activator